MVRIVRQDNSINVRKRSIFEYSLRNARCPEDGDKILEINQPEVVCGKCMVHYIFAIQTYFSEGHTIIQYELVPLL